MLKINISLIVVLLLTIVFESNAQSQIVEIESTTQGFLPPRMTTTQRDAIASPSNGLIIFNTSTGRLNYYNAGWLELYPGPNTGLSIQDLLDAGQTPLMLINAGAAPSDFIGLNYQGGIIFYLEADNTGGLVSAPTDQSTGAPWGCEGTLIFAANETSIAAGGSNTSQINSGCTEPNIAAKICLDLDLNGFDDWVLPSRDGLIEMYNKIGPGAAAPNTNIGEFMSAAYWSSTQTSDINANLVQFNNGSAPVFEKSNSLRVRAIRKF